MNMAPTVTGVDPAIRVLIVEDMPHDAELMSRELTRSGLAFVTQRVETEPGFREALKEFRPDVILADYSLPRFSGVTASRIVKELHLDTPVILVSGEITEKVAIHCLQLGVADYILKDNLLRLGPAVRATLETARIRQARVEVQEERRSLEKMLWAIADSTSDAMIVSDANGRVRFWNRGATDIFGFSKEDILGEPMIKIVPQRFRSRHEAGMRSVMQGKPLGAGAIRTTGLRKDGTELPIELSLGSWKEGGETWCSAVVRDITDRVAAEGERALLSAVAEQSSDLVIITNTEGRIQYVNRAFETITGYSSKEVLGQTPRFLKSGHQEAGFYEKMWAELTAGRSWTSDFVNHRKDGTEYVQRSTIFPILDAEGRAANFVGIGQDVTKERSLERQLRQAQKMEAVGQLTGGIAHDFNNILAAILTNAQLLTMALPPELTGEESEVRDIEHAARRGADLIKKLMAFSRDEYLDLEVVDLSEILEESMSLLRRIIPADITLTLDEAHGEARVSVDRSGMQQILLNLATNARDSMPEGGTLAISTCVMDADRGQGQSEGHARVEISIRDTGVGMDAETLERAFDPFFTTKDRGSGTGLGLAMVHTLVARHHGTIDVESEPEVGTTFTLSLPVASPAPDTPIKLTSAGEKPVSETEPAATVLLVEDEDPLRRAGARALERSGYRVLTAENGRKALELLEIHREEVSLVLTDLIMPEMGGGELYQATRSWQPRPPFLIMTGYGPREVAGKVLDDGVPILRKPWGVADLVEAVEEALERA